MASPDVSTACTLMYPEWRYFKHEGATLARRAEAPEELVDSSVAAIDDGSDLRRIAALLEELL